MSYECYMPLSVYQLEDRQKALVAAHFSYNKACLKPAFLSLIHKANTCFKFVSIKGSSQFTPDTHSYCRIHQKVQVVKCCHRTNTTVYRSICPYPHGLTFLTLSQYRNNLGLKEYFTHIYLLKPPSFISLGTDS